jgi:hypothetical protein
MSGLVGGMIRIQRVGGNRDCPKGQCHHPMLSWKQYSVVNKVSGGFLLPSSFLQQEVLPS